MDSEHIIVWNGVVTRFHFIRDLFESDNDGLVQLASMEEIEKYKLIKHR